MYRLKPSYASLMVFVTMMSSCTDSIEYRQPRRELANVTSSSGEVEVVEPYWEDILREFIFKTISPSPSANNLLYKRILEAPFYGGPFPTLSGNETTVILSRGNVFYFPSEHWILCQEGCVDCDACAEQRNPTVKWILKRIKRLSSFLPPRYDLQLTIIPQNDGTFHMKNLWPRSYVYVTPQTDKQQNRPSGIPGYPNWESVFYYDNGSITEQNYNKPARSWRLVERNVENEKQDATKENFTLPTISSNSSRISVSEPNFVVKNLEHLPEQKHELKSTQRQFQQTLTTDVPLTTSLTPYDDALNIDSNGYNEAEQFTPKLILGTDYSGSKHVIHIIPVEGLSELSSANVNYVTNYPSLEITDAGPNSHFNNTVQTQKNHAMYDKFFHRILVSLNNHKTSIEKFLQSSKNNAAQDEKSSSTSYTVPVQSIEPQLPSTTIIVPKNLENAIKKERFNSDDVVAYSSPSFIRNEEGKHSEEPKEKDEIMLYSKPNAVNNHEGQYQKLPRAIPNAQKPNMLRRIKQRRHRLRGNDVDRFTNKTAATPRNNVEIKSPFIEQEGDNNHSASYQQGGQGEALAQIERKLADGGFLRNVGNYKKETNGHLQKFDGLLNDNNSRNRPRHIRIDPRHRLPIMERIRGGTNYEETYQTNLRNNFTKSNSPSNIPADFVRN